MTKISLWVGVICFLKTIKHKIELKLTASLLFLPFSAKAFQYLHAGAKNKLFYIAQINLPYLAEQKSKFNFTLNKCRDDHS